MPEGVSGPTSTARGSRAGGVRGALAPGVRTVFVRQMLLEGLER